MDQPRFSVSRMADDGSFQQVSKPNTLDHAVEVFSNTISAASSRQVLITNGQIVLEWTLGGGLRRV